MGSPFILYKDNLFKNIEGGYDKGLFKFVGDNSDSSSTTESKSIDKPVSQAAQMNIPLPNGQTTYNSNIQQPPLVAVHATQLAKQYNAQDLYADVQSNTYKNTNILEDELIESLNQKQIYIKKAKVDTIYRDDTLFVGQFDPILGYAKPVPS